MGLFIELGAHGVIFSDLLQLVGCDPGLTTTTPDLQTLQVHFTQKKATTPTSSMVLALVNAAKNVLIRGVVSSAVIPGGTQPITKYTGGFCLAGNLTTPIIIYLDVTDGGGGGQFYVVHDQAGQDIFEPRQVILCHELAHAYHMTKGDEPALDTDKEIQAVADENTFRAAVNLPLRHATDHYGTLGVPAHGGVAGIKGCTPEYAGWSPGWKCPTAVAAATLGSSDAPEIAELRRARHQYRSVGLWAALIAEPVLEAYRQFSPRVVRDMLLDPPLRRAMLFYVVQPTLQILPLAESYLAAAEDTPELLSRVDRAFDRYLSAIASAGSSASILRDVADGAVAASGRLAAAGDGAPSASAACQWPRDVFPYVATAIGDHDGRRTFGWAFAGLALFLRQAADRLDGAPGDPPAFLGALGDWAAGLPLPPVAQLRLADAPHELSVLGERVFTRPDARERFARHLLAQWPDGSAVDLRLLLRSLRYLDAR